MKLKVKSFPAPLWKRVLAYIIDTIIISFVISMPFQGVLEDLQGDVANKGFLETYTFFSQNPYFLESVFPHLISIFFIVSALSILYWAILEYKIGQSVGKILMRLRVISDDKKLTFGRCIIRNITKVGTILLILDTLYLFFSRTNQRYFEKITQTKVIEERVSL